MSYKLRFEEKTHKYFVTEGGEPERATPGVNEILDAMLPGSEERKEYFDDYCAIRGTHIHKAIELASTDELDFDSLDPALVKYVCAWQEFAKQHEFKFIKPAEFRLYSPSLNYAGSIDGVGSTKTHGIVVADWKTGELQRRHQLQLAAYSFLTADNGQRVNTMLAVKLCKDGTYKVKELNARKAAVVWLCKLDLYHSRNRVGSVSLAEAKRLAVVKSVSDEWDTEFKKEKVSA